MHLRNVLEEQLDMDWELISEHYGNQVNSEVLLPYARYDI